ncbi:hypothetical protein J2X28_002228 [Kocuria rhizophila]|uniref:hypothetical protein n=1 Tax=Kocuria rhizophila TaxID=72000 RepID=UPI002019BBE1|nr:hypothetical protein [Kocuria rhizophila]MDR7375229.1 hypothetical protein [Kocuria rhizophila]
MNYDPQALADAETYLVNFLENSNPRRDASMFEITEAAQDFHASTGGWDVAGASAHSIEDLLARHAK